jgi:hypothetical protein
MRLWALSAAIGAAIMTSSSGSASPVQGVVSGIYVREMQQKDDAFEAIESAVAGLPDAKRPFLRSRLLKSVAAVRIRLSSSGNRGLDRV